MGLTRNVLAASSLAALLAGPLAVVAPSVAGAEGAGHVGPAGPSASSSRAADSEWQLTATGPNEPGSMGAASVASSAAFSPCTGRATRPYKGGTKNTLSSAETDCDYIMQSVYVNAKLQRGRWYGAQTIDSNSRTAYGDLRTGVSLGWTCKGAGTYTYWTSSSHEAVLDGTKYVTSGRTADSRFNC